MGAGDYRFPVTFEEPIRTENELGEQEISFRPVVNVWVAIDPYKANELLWARQAQLQVSHHVRSRWFDGPKSDWRITWQEPDGTTRALNIVSMVDPGERHIEWKFECMEQKSG